MIFGCPFASDAGSGMRVVLLPDAEPESRIGPIATDSAAAPHDEIPVIPVPDWAAREFLQPSRSALREAEFIASFYEGVPFAEGERRRIEYFRRRTERAIERSRP